MSVRDYLSTAPLHDIVKYDSTVDLSRDCVPFTGTPRKHPYDETKLLLISDPFSDQAEFFEFRIKDIVHVDDLPSIGNESGENTQMVKIWVLKGRVALRYEPFEVQVDRSNRSRRQKAEENTEAN